MVVGTVLNFTSTFTELLPADNEMSDVYQVIPQLVLTVTQDGLVDYPAHVAVYPQPELSVAVIEVLPEVPLIVYA